MGRSRSPLTPHTAASLNARGRASLDLGVLLVAKARASGRPLLPTCGGSAEAGRGPRRRFLERAGERRWPGSGFPGLTSPFQTSRGLASAGPPEGSVHAWSRCLFPWVIGDREAFRGPCRGEGLPGCALCVPVVRCPPRPALGWGRAVLRNRMAAPWWPRSLNPGSCPALQGSRGGLSFWR